MASVDAATTSAFQPSNLYFRCQHCEASLAVKATFAEPLLECHQCGEPTSVPIPAAPCPTAPDLSEQLAEWQRHLKENESQRTEVNGHINQLNIQIHRWQLRLQTLNARNQELTRQIAEITGTNQTPQ
ncbi:MAG: hypothetical protein H0T83_01160 [Chthoniobacterales bacterium]|nr:hypothetical protein [Chthoniobacterales bacterium]